MSAYETVLDAIIDALEAAVVACTSFVTASVHFDYVRTEDYGTYDPICLLSLHRVHWTKGDAAHTYLSSASLTHGNGGKG